MPDRSQLYQQSFLSLVRYDKNIRLYGEKDRGFLYRPGQMLCAPQDTPRVVERLRRLGYQPREGQGFGGVRRLLFADPKVDIPSMVSVLRKPDDGQPVPLVQPHHVLFGYPNLMGNPGGPPSTSAGIPDPDPSRLSDGHGVSVGVLDTGISASASTDHPSWLGGHYVPEADDEDALYAQGNRFAMEGGHGTFVAGVLRQAAPGIDFDPERALTPQGVGDEESVVAALNRLRQGYQILNLSLGCTTQDDQPSLPLGNALRPLDERRIVVVAAAGNAGTNQPRWPAAFPWVVGVAAVESSGEKTVRPAKYSSFGPWVDACALGERESTYAQGTWHLDGDPDDVAFGRFAKWAGTSFSAPHVAGRIATLMTSNGLSAQDAKALLLSAPRFLPDYGVLVD